MKLNELDQELRNKMRYEYIGQLIFRLRKEKGYTQRDLAAKAGINDSVISRLELSMPPKGCSLATFFKIADALEVEPSALLPNNHLTIIHEEDWLEIDNNEWILEEDLFTEEDLNTIDFS